MIKKYDNIKCLIFKKNMINFLYNISQKDFSRLLYEIQLYEIACSIGDLRLLEYFQKNNIHVYYLIFTNNAKYAAANGHLDCLKYVHKNERACMNDEETTYLAAAGGHLDCLKYVHENGGCWHPETTLTAAAGGHLSVLMYAYENGCPWHPKTALKAIEGKHWDCVKYARNNGYVDFETMKKYMLQNDLH